MTKSLLAESVNSETAWTGFAIVKLCNATNQPRHFAASDLVRYCLSMLIVFGLQTCICCEYFE